MKAVIFDRDGTLLDSEHVAVDAFREAHRRTVQLLGDLALSTFFVAVATPDDPPAAKPTPDGVHWLCSRMGVRAEDSVVIGDASSDIRAGRSAGAQTIGCCWGVSSPGVLRQAGADEVVRTPKELVGALLPLRAQ